MATEVAPGVWYSDRSELGLRPARSRVVDADYRGLADHWEGPTLHWPWPHTSCPTKWRAIQAYHMDGPLDAADIAYQFGYCGHGYVLEGRGWDVRSAANGSAAVNDLWGAVCYLGGVGDEHTAEARRARRWLHEEAVRRGRPENTTHRRIRPDPTACPGDLIDAWVMAGLPIDQEDDMPLDDNDKAWIHTTLISVLRSEGASGGALNCASALRAEGVSGANVTATAILAKIDAEALSAALLEVLTPEAVAAVISAGLAAQVADEFGTRLAG